MTQSKTLFGLPEKVRFCKKCVMSNQRPCSYPEFKHTKDRITPTLHIDDDGLCDACRYNEQKKDDIDWKAREEQLMQLCDKHRRNDGGYDCIVPGSGGKDSCLAAHTLKYEYGMNPLTVTWPPIMYTEYGYKNFRNWIEIGGFDNITFNQNGRAHKLLTKLAIENLFHPFQTFILGQKNLAPKIALEYNIPLIFYGEPEAEYGNPIAETSSSLRDKSYYSMKNIDDLYLGGISIKKLMEVHGLRLNELSTYFPADAERLEKSKIEVHYLGYYVPWTPQEAYYYAVENTGFEARPFRTQGTYSKYNSIDDKIDDLHYYTTYIKFGIGRTTYDASQEIRNKHLTREEGVALVHKYDGEFPNIYFDDIMEYLGITSERFQELTDQNRSPHLWEKVNGEWKLKHRVENL
ncbi:LPS biosynthesis protein PseA [Pseudodesulfovibrio nedwellii]|uniref:LPS biosynthesis protein PseA n=1 Tax=Pseudodesulfovibrio nedwellii TaxID=2973072 RepID=A0ABN6S030_9BACT|nr:N-acetyl sugar amidotransferase [Pseudodesulfovibrio nedwellii]BDQ36600.1 LPS biosynthesis protein PseA [Pseudodesulfovibrio nedwellii]